ncbi:hypothetical protein B9P52_23310 [Achromobacter denitrificans]|uniref:hypothetical protein n=1 Tax=Achromobacter denitrificans TaxID=32002 RepID=UPI000B4DBF4D|nr:hypothetical protein [Achromobacter denitrificans]ASC67023.1 hypothetical protein B9P52_23310 [Achromobacter denitrificans]
MKLKPLPDAIADPLAFEAEAQGWRGNGAVSLASNVSAMSPVELMRHALVKLENSSVYQTPEKAAAMQYLVSAISMVSVVTCS